MIGDAVNACPPSVGVCETATIFLAQNNGLVVLEHEYYQMFTSIFVTAYPLDAGFNAIAVLILDRITEDTLDKTRYFAIFFGSAIFGNILTLVQGENYASAGASGGIFGIFAALVAFSWLRDKKPDVPVLAFFIIIFFGSSIIGNVNYVAHIGGAIGGVIGAGILYQSIKGTISEYSFQYKSGRVTGLITLSLILVGGAASVAQFLLFTGL